MLYEVITFRVINDPVFKITGGQMGLLDSTFYLVGGHLFDGRYNPMGRKLGQDSLRYVV